tara:strand:- start:869 stop:1138 length:270 start_codon:yes stop_codon:yes gene_type:complete
MCVGNLFRPKPPKIPEQAQPDIAPALAPVTPLEDPGKDVDLQAQKKPKELITTKRKTALSIKKAREGVKQLGAINPKSIPSAPKAGITI